MKSRIMMAITSLLFSLFAGTALAGPQSGFGLNAGFASHSRDCGGCAGSSTSGLSLGLDYQIAVSDKFSINPFLMSSGESTSVDNVSIGHGILGVQLRYWVGDVFFGGHVGSYSEVLTSGSASLSGNGMGTGLVAGWQKPDGGLYVMGQVDSATMTYSGYADIPFSAFRFSAGYRFK